MANDFQLDEIPIPRATPVEAQLAPIVRGAEQQEQQTQGQVEQVPKAWGMRGAGFAGTGAGIANIAESILRGWLAGKATAAATMARQTVAEVSAAKQTHRENEQALANALQKTMDPTVAADPALKAKADAEVATAQANYKSSWSTYRGILEKHALPEQAEQRAKQGRGVGGRIVHGMVGAFKAKDPTSAVLAAVYSGLPEEAPLPAIDPFAATKSQMLATAVKGGKQQLEAGKLGMEATRQQIKIGEQQIDIGGWTVKSIGNAHKATTGYVDLMEQINKLKASGRGDNDPQVQQLQKAADAQAELHDVYDPKNPLPRRDARALEQLQQTYERAKTEQGMRMLHMTTAALEKQQRGEKLSAFDQMLIGMRPENVLQTYWQAFGGDGLKAAQKMHTDALELANVAHQANGYAYLYKAARVIEDDNWHKAGNTGPAPEANVARHFEQIDRPQAFRVPTRTFTEGDKQRTLSSYLAQVFKVKPEWGKYGFASGTMGKGIYDTVARRPTPDIGTMPWNKGEVKNQKELDDYDDFYGTLLSLTRSRYDQSLARTAEARQRGEAVDIKQIPPSPSELGLTTDSSQPPATGGGIASPAAGPTSRYNVVIDGRYQPRDLTDAQVEAVRTDAAKRGLAPPVRIR
jgi:hypothetical protein